jgi:hypothetical protein
MKKLLSFTLFIITLAFPIQSVSAADTSPGPNTAPMLNPWVVVNSNNTVTVFWNQIQDVGQYRVCVNAECPAKWNAYTPSENNATFPLGINETKTFWVHALLLTNATNYNTLDLRACCNGVKWADSFKWVTASNVAVIAISQIKTNPTPTTIATIANTTTTTIPQWKYVWINKTHTKQIRTGALCYSGRRSTATGSGACSWNGGVKNWIYYSTKSTSKVKYKCWLNKNTNTYNKNCIAV